MSHRGLQRPCIAILLAAGASRRLGRPKQLLPIGGRTLIEHTIGRLQRTNAERVIIITGARSDAITSVVHRLYEPRLKCVENKHWASGQASSLALGLSTARDLQRQANVLVALCDQPLIESSHYQSLIDTVGNSSASQGVSVAATKYDSGGGVPACFSPDVLPELINRLQGEGAKHWIRRQSSSRVVEVECDQPLSDIDTEADYQAIDSVVR